MGRTIRIIAISLVAYTFVAALSYGNTIHILSQGETLYSLARQYGVSLDRILAENNIDDPSGLPIGARLVIPGSGSVGTETVVESAFHVVSKGDTYYGIARKYGLEINELLTMNGRSSSDVLSIGDRLKIGERTDTARVSAQNTSPPPGDNSRYAAAVRVNEVPWWPVSGIKRPLEGKLVGVSIETDSMSYVHAVSSGNVVWTGPYRGFGHVVLVDSGGYIYLYGGNEDLFVNVGQKVSAGNRIGRLGSGGPGGEQQEMYFSVFREGVPVSPEDAPRG